MWGDVVTTTEHSWSLIRDLPPHYLLGEGHRVLRAPPGPLYAQWAAVLGWCGRGMANTSHPHHGLFWKLFPLLPHMIIPRLHRSTRDHNDHSLRELRERMELFCLGEWEDLLVPQPRALRGVQP